MTRTLRFLCAFLFLGTTACSLVLSASSTLAKAHAVHVPDGAVWSAVGVLEMVSLAATLRWLTATTRRGQVEAWVISGLVLLVTGVAGCAAYGWFGLVAPAGVVACVYMVHATLADAKEVEEAEAAAAPTEVFDVVPPEHAPTETIAKPELVAMTVKPKALEPATVPSALEDIDSSIVERALTLLAENPKVGRPRLRAELGVTDHTAKRLLAALRPVKAVEEESA